MDWKKKLTSRKFWMAVCSFVASIIVIFGCGENVATQVTGAITAFGTVVAYIVGEGMIDAQNK